MKTSRVFAALCAAGMLTAVAPEARAQERSFSAGSLIIPMDLAYQDSGLLQAYGLVFQLLRQQVPLYWVIDPSKTWHHAPCDTSGDECSWDCAEEGSGVRCPYPTANPDFFVGATVVWDGDGALASGATISNHGYRGGPFVIDVADADRALPIIEAWNDEASWPSNPWAERSAFQVVSVHEANADFDGFVRKEMVAAPSIAVFSDGNEDIATGYLRAAGIPQSNGSEFPVAKCGAGDCGAGTDNPDMLTVPSVAGDLGTCDAPNSDHRNGELFRDGVPAYCQIMSMHWGVKDRETVECDGGDCGASQSECGNKTITYHGHEVVAEVRAFLAFPVHFFAECQAVNAYENTTPNPEWPFLDDPERDGHFLTTQGSPPACDGNNPCTDGDFECVTGGCNGGAQDCCLPSDDKEKGAGFLIAEQPNASELQILRQDVPYNQLDGFFDTVGGSEPAYNLSSYLGTTYKNDRDVTFITGPNGPGEQDVWMTGYLDGECPNDPPVPRSGAAKRRDDEVCGGKVSYLGGHRYDTSVPVSSSPSTQGTRLFLNALFEADCVTTEGQPDLSVQLTGDSQVPIALPQGTYTIGYRNQGLGTALDGQLVLEMPAGVSADDAGSGTVNADTITIDVGSIGQIDSVSPPSIASHEVVLSFDGEGQYTLQGHLLYRVGLTDLVAGPVTLDVEVGDFPTGGGGAGAGAGVGGAGTGSGDDGGCGCHQQPRLASHAWLTIAALGLGIGLRRARRGAGLRDAAGASAADRR